MLKFIISKQNKINFAGFNYINEKLFSNKSENNNN